MKGLPDRFYEWVGGSDFLGKICPARERTGAVVEEIAALSHAELAGGQRIACGEALELVRGGVFYAVDALARAHSIFQEDASALGAYWHGMMHRREGDFGNACYWFGRAGKLPALGLLPGFDPAAFTRRCAKEGRDTPELVEWQRKEWEALMTFCLEKALADDVRPEGL
jgi:hypothetical protein